MLLRDLLSDDGALYVHLDWKKVHYVKVIMDELLGEHGFRNHIIWHYPGREMHITTKFNSKYDSLLFYAKSEATKVRMSDVAIPYDRAERLKGLRRKVHTDKDGTEWVWETRGQSAGQEPYKRTVDDIIQQGRPLSDVWDDLQFLRGNHPERTGYPTQKPSWLLERVIRASSDKGDIVLDCFAGSGTACAVAERLGRRWIAIDCGKLAIYTIQKRMLNLHIEIGRPTFKLKPFTLYNAGLYDFSTLRKLPWRDWRFFALQLFGCKDEPHTIGGLCLDGKLKGASVLVFNHLDQPGHRIDEDTILGIHSAIGSRIGRKFFIIAPRGVFDFQQDYIDVDGVRYYALRIPYSIINELHQREFTALQQPHDEMSVNDTVDAVGFDFIQPPKVHWTLSVVRREGQLIPQACLKIRGFRSTARLRGRETKGDLETISMVMVDLDYNGDVFNMGAVFYAQQLSDGEWSAWLPIEHLGKTLMVVFIDIYGNEAREVIETGPILHPKASGKKGRQ